MRAKFKTPTRLCKRCNVEHPAEKFMPTGEVCYDCKMLAIQKRDTRDKYDPATHRKWLDKNRDKWNDYQREYRARRKREQVRV